MDNHLTKNESFALRGFCITLIVLHNFIHSVVPYVENEKWFNVANANYLIDNFFSHPVLASFSYFGWLGVPMFFFLSGYGLNRKYGSVVQNKFSFIIWHYLKILLLAGPIVLLSNFLAHSPVLHTLGQMTFLNNLFGSNWIRPASFWYLRVALEFYILYALLFHRINSKILLIIALAVTCSFYFMDWQTVRCLKYHNVGWLLDFALGMYTANNPQWIKYLERIWLSVILLALLVFASLYEYGWIFSDTISILFILSIKKYLTIKPIVFLGTISAYLYVIHSVVRHPWLFMNIDYMNGNPWVAALSICAYFIVCVGVAYVYGIGYRKVFSFIQRKSPK